MPRNAGIRPTETLSSRVGGGPGERVQFHVRDIENRRDAGVFESESTALAFLKGGGDGRFSINNHRGDWCEVLVRGGERYVRHALMAEGGPAAFLSIEPGSRGTRVEDGPALTPRV